MACCSTSTTHSCSVHSSNTGSSLSTISSSSSSSSTTSTATTTTGNINSANTSVTTTNNHCISSNSNSSTASIISSTLLNPSGVSNISSIASFVNQSHVDVNLQPSAFPKGYIPKLSNDSTKWTCVFQNEWAEIAIVYYDGTDGQLSRQQIRGDKTANMNDSPSTTDTTPPPPATTTTTTSTTTTTATMNSSQTNDSSLSPLPSSSSSSCSTPRIQCKTLTEKDCFIKDGLLKYSLISSLFGIPDKTGFQGECVCLCESVYVCVYPHNLLCFFKMYYYYYIIIVSFNS
ncbi:unnamed protein product [Trichobilharzia regenti]|nr:unnamed protein product [Trichobilharzia regenti]